MGVKGVTDARGRASIGVAWSGGPPRACCAQDVLCTRATRRGPPRAPCLLVSPGPPPGSHPPGGAGRALRQAGWALRLALAAAALRGASAQFCDPGWATACDLVLVVGADPDSWLEDIAVQLLSTGSFARVDYFPAGIATPWMSLLLNYHAVIVYSGLYFFSDAQQLGDILAAYHELGGGVVVANFANADNNPARLLGAFADVAQGYALLAAGGYTTSPADWNGLIAPSDVLGEVLEPQSPLLAGVASLAAINAYRSTAAVVRGRGIVVARWRGGFREPLVVRGVRGNRTLVELNFFPPSSAVNPAFWTGSGAALMRNALKYSRCTKDGPLLCGPGSFLEAGAGAAHDMALGQSILCKKGSLDLIRWV